MKQKSRPLCTRTTGIWLNPVGWYCRNRSSFQNLSQHFCWLFLERKTRLELATLTLARLCSTNWAISANQTRSFRLGLQRYALILNFQTFCEKSAKNIEKSVSKTKKKHIMLIKYLIKSTDGSVLYFQKLMTLPYVSSPKFIIFVRSCSGSSGKFNRF